MTVLLYLAAFLAVAVGIAHSILGGRYILAAGLAVLLIGGACLYAAMGPASIATRIAAKAYGRNPIAGSTFSFNGTRFYYETYGSGPPLLLIHGNGQSIAGFKEQIGPLSKGHQVIAMDSRGQGKSELGTAAFTYEQMAEDCNALLDHLKLDHVKVLGWSDGGIIGLLLAIHHPEKVGMLAAMAANIEPDGVYPWAVDGIARLRSRTTAELAHTDNPKPLQFQLQLLDLMGYQPHIPLADLNKIQAPTLVMAGDRDVIRDDHTLSIFHAIPTGHLPRRHASDPRARSGTLQSHGTRFLRQTLCDAGYEGSGVVRLASG
jgi:pimeloyl-ACP methyl ester carboxylesterase